MKSKLCLILTHFCLSLLITSCLSEIDVTTFEENASSDLNEVSNEKQFLVKDINIVNIGVSSFAVELDYSYDANTNSSVEIFYCNGTVDVNCNPVLGGSTSLSKLGASYSTSISSLTTNSYQDTIRYILVVTDADGVVNKPSVKELTLERQPATQIYRSVGVGSTSAIDDNSTGTMDIVGDTATFSTPIANNVGVGDVVVYDADSKIAFISGRLSSTQYILKKADGVTDADSISSNSDWSIYRAYLSLVDAENGDENTGIPGAVRDFDARSGGYDITALNEQLNFALYADGFETVTGRVDFHNPWKSSEKNPIKIYSPYDLSEVGVSQRHSGVFDRSKYYLHVNAGQNYARGISFYNDADGIIIDGVQFLVRGNGFNWPSGFHKMSPSDNTRVVISNNIVQGVFSVVDSNSDSHGGFRMGSSSVPLAEYKIFNNIISGMTKNGYSTGVEVSGTSYIYNNTIYNCNRGLYFGAGNHTLKNNIVKANSDVIRGNSHINTAESRNNIYSLSDANYHSSDRVISDLDYNSKEAHDYRISGTAFEAIGTGVDLSNDPDLVVTTDISGNTRTRWDVGASTAATAIFRSIGPGNNASLKGSSDKELSISLDTNGHTVLSLTGGTTSLPGNVGVGDVIEYDHDNSGGISHLAFIHKRIDADTFYVKNNNGENAEVTTSSNITSWNIFRAYTSLQNAENGISENTSISGALQDFDSWSGVNDLTISHKQWNYALYGDGIGNSVVYNNWKTSSLNFLRLFSPHLDSEVGISQRTSGVWEVGKATITGADYFGIVHLHRTTTLHHARVEGIQIENNDPNTSNTGRGIEAGNQAAGIEFHITGNLVRKTNGTWSTSNGITLSSNRGTRHFIANNVVEAFNRGIVQFSTDGRKASVSVVYNNTVFADSYGYNDADYGDGSFRNIKNNIFLNASTEDYHMGSTPDNLVTSANITLDNTSPEGANFQGRSPDFFDAAGGDFRLVIGDAEARGRGVDLSSDEFYSFEKDITGTDRVIWDIGAFVYQ